MQLAEHFDADWGRMARLARHLGLSPAFLSQIAKGVRPAPAERCAAIEQATSGAVRRWDLRPRDWHRIWPELIGAEGAPALPVDGARDAA